MQLYLTVRPEDTRTASAYPAGLAHAAYRIGERSSLLSRNLLTPARSGQMAPLPGLLVLSDRSAPSIDRPAALAEAVLRECARRSYGGIVLDFDEPSREDRRRFAALLGQQCAKSRKFFYLPPSYAGAAEHPIVIVNTAISGGSFETHIREELARYGGGRNVVFDLQRLRMDFRLPARSGQGEPLTQAALDALSISPPCFFPKTCLPATSLMPRTVNPTSSSLMTLTRCAKSCVLGGSWAWPPRFSSGRRSATSPTRCSAASKKEVPHLSVRYFCFLVETLLVLTSGLRLLATLHAGAFIMLSLANLGDNACLSAATLKTLQCAIDGFAFLDMNLRHLYFPPSETSGLILDA